MKSKQQGNVGLGQAIAYFTAKGHVVSIPLNDSQDYDLIVEIDSELKKVQVKTTNCVSPSGAMIVSLKSDSTYTYKEFNNNATDYLFVYSFEGFSYLIPCANITQKTGMYVGGPRKLNAEYIV